MKEISCIIKLEKDCANLKIHAGNLGDLLALIQVLAGYGEEQTDKTAIEILQAAINGFELGLAHGVSTRAVVAATCDMAVNRQDGIDNAGHNPVH